MTIWEVGEAKLDSDELTDLLDDGWEPFSAYTVGSLSRVDVYIVLRLSRREGAG